MGESSSGIGCVLERVSGYWTEELDEAVGSPRFVQTRASISDDSSKVREVSLINSKLVNPDSRKISCKQLNYYYYLELTSGLSNVFLK